MLIFTLKSIDIAAYNYCSIFRDTERDFDVTIESDRLKFDRVSNREIIIIRSGSVSGTWQQCLGLQ
ncbi:MAG: hypothetical protein ACRC62_06070 [Microcoleus sp.]